MNHYSYCLKNPLIYSDPKGYKWNWNWLNPFWHFDNLMQWVNDNTTGTRQKMADAGVPPFGGGYNSTQGSFHYVGNGGNNFHNQSGSNANNIVYGAINDARAEYFSYQKWQAIGVRDILSQQFVGESPLAQKTANRSNWFYGAGVGLYTLGNMGTGGELFLGSVTSFFHSMNEYSAPVQLTYTAELNKMAKATKGVKFVGGVVVMAGGILDFEVGVPSYYRNGPNHPLSVSPSKADVNLGIGAYSVYVNPTAGPIYFGYELFYPGGFRGASEAATQAEQRMMQYPWYNYFNKQ